MNTSSVPRLRQEAIVRPFDDRRQMQRYIIAIDGCHFVVTPTVAAVLEETRNLRIGEGDLKSLGVAGGPAAGQDDTAAADRAAAE